MDLLISEICHMMLFAFPDLLNSNGLSQTFQYDQVDQEFRLELQEHIQSNTTHLAY